VNAIPVSRPDLGSAERAALLKCFDAGWLSSDGPQVPEFEQAFASAHGRAHGIAVSSGTAALDIAIRALGLGPGDEVLVPSLTIISCAMAIVDSGAKPVPVDCSPEDWNAALAHFEARMTSQTRAIILVHLYGLCADLDPILEWAARRGLVVIEDASQAQGLVYRNRRCGTFGEVSAFSLYANKLVTTGEGGMILCDSPRIAEACRSLRNLCFDRGKRFWHRDLGWNYRMSAVQAAIGTPQVGRLDDLAARMRRIGERYRQAFARLGGFALAPLETPYVRNGYWVFGLVVEPDAPFTRDDLIQALAAERIGSRTFFYGLHEQPALLERKLVDRVSLPTTERLSRQGLYLPGGLGLSDADQDRVVGAVTRFVDARS
jgi:perosamine synthetase